MSQYIVTTLWIASEHEMGADPVQQEGWEESDGGIPSIVKFVEHFEKRTLSHVVAKVGTQGIAKVLPALSVGQ